MDAKRLEEIKVRLAAGQLAAADASALIAEVERLRAALRKVATICGGELPLRGSQGDLEFAVQSGWIVSRNALGDS